ncbi:uncharacterized protein LOC126675073 [Mercurialis annua]|uniref:uncharacterized protein LOC126675073 n=1 Tax=Mercurialis annua TaxID=3986 RepID=UPI00215F6633|nr:uncharacterized protein LOC126675073 [Mercurialis annua]
MHYFPLTPRLQRLYASRATASEMRWHGEHEMEDDKMCHPSDSKAWKHFDQCHPQFALEIRNVRLGLCTDGFQPFGQSGQQYSLWPVVVTPYNLPPGLCMKEEFMFLTILVPGPYNPKSNMDVFLQLLIAEFNSLWSIGVQTYDISKRQNFTMRAALMWTINDFPAYGRLSGWSTSGRLACPYCMEDTDAKTLKISGKQSWFDNHRKFLPPDHIYRRNTNSFTKNTKVTKVFRGVKSGEEILNNINGRGFMKVTEDCAEAVNAIRSKNCGWHKKSIFWDLPYWSTNLVRHNLDVMHIEKNVFDNIFNTVLNIAGRTKDTAKSRDEFNDICRRPELAMNPDTGRYPKASYVLDRPQKQLLFEWVKDLKFPDGYVSNMGRCVDSKKLKMFGMKSHDCHIFMQQLLPIAFRELLPKSVWEPITQLCLFFKELTASNLKVEDMELLDKQIPIILCKLERIFPPNFFDSMEHLPVHLAYEAMLAGPVHYRWMYPFERYLRKVKRKITNKYRVEGSISKGYVLEEAAKFASFYFKEGDPTVSINLPRNEVVMDDDEDVDRLSIFKYPGKQIGAIQTRRYLPDIEYAAARVYILLNCPKVEQFVGMYTGEIRARTPGISEEMVASCLEKEFAIWFEKYVSDPTNNISNPYIQSLSQGPLRQVKTFNGYYVNGFKFHTRSHDSGRATFNSGVCIKASNYDAATSDFYGIVTEILELEYRALPLKTTMLFMCDWFNPTPNVGMIEHMGCNIVDVHRNKRYNKYEPFVLAAQACQVYYCEYPGAKRDRINWLAVCKIKARSDIDFPESSNTDSMLPPFQEDSDRSRLNVIADGEAVNLIDPDEHEEDIDETEIAEEDIELVTSSEGEEDTN